MKDRKMSFYNRIVKRMLDIICSLAAIMCLSVLYLPICAIIKCTSEGPVFFRQKRIGKNKKYFNILKFRTMRIDTPKDCLTHLLKNPEQYITMTRPPKVRPKKSNFGGRYFYVKIQL